MLLVCRLHSVRHQNMESRWYFICDRLLECTDGSSKVRIRTVEETTVYRCLTQHHIIERFANRYINTPDKHIRRRINQRNEVPQFLQRSAEPRLFFSIRSYIPCHAGAGI